MGHVQSRRGHYAGRGGITMFFGLFVILAICWLFGFIVLHVAGGLIHLLLVIAVISLIWHFMRPAARV